MCIAGFYRLGIDMCIVGFYRLGMDVCVVGFYRLGMDACTVGFYRLGMDVCFYRLNERTYLGFSNKSSARYESRGWKLRYCISRFNYTISIFVVQSLKGYNSVCWYSACTMRTAAVWARVRCKQGRGSE